MQASTANTGHDRGSPVPAQVPPELLETVARALAAALVPPPRQPAPSRETADFLTAAQLAQRLGVSRETVRRLAIAGALPHTVVCRGTRKTTRRYPRRFADEFAASGLDTADLAVFAAAWRARVTAPVRRRPARRVPAPLLRQRRPRLAGVTGLRAAAPTWRCSSPAAGSRPSPRGGSARIARCGSSAWSSLSHGIVHGIWGGLAERDRRALRTRHAGAARRERDAAIAAVATAGYSKAAIGRAFGLAATSVSRVLSRDAGRRRS